MISLAACSSITLKVKYYPHKTVFLEEIQTIVNSRDVGHFFLLSGKSNKGIQDLQVQ